MRSMLFAFPGIALATALCAAPAAAQCGSPVLNQFFTFQGQGPLLWTPDGAPVTGTPFSIALAGASPGHPAALFVSLAESAIAVPFGFFYPDLSVALPAIFFVVPPAGAVPLGGLASVPPAYCGYELFAQVFVAGSGPGGSHQLSNALHARFGDSPGFSFAPESTIPVGESPRGLTTGDFNADGVSDFAVANTSTNDVSVLLADSDDLVDAGTYAVGMCPADVRTADIDLDGDLDLVTCNSGSNDISSMLGHGDGIFDAAVTGPSVAGPRGLVLGDFDGDGFPDAAVCNFSADLVTVLVGVGDGSFVPGPVITSIDGPFHQEAADMNGDGFLDLVVAARSSGTVEIALNNGDGTFQTPLSTPVGSSPRRLAVGDFNEDGLPDVVAANWSDDTASVLLGIGNGSLLPFALLPTLDRPTHIELADADGDGHLDLAVSGMADILVSIASGDGAGGFAAFVDVPIAIADAPNSFFLRDVDYDGIPDLVLSSGPSGAGGCPAPTGAPGAVTLRRNLLGD